MRVSQFPLATLKEVPADAEVISHQYMLRAGLIRKLAAGLYTWLPMGLRVLHKVEDIVRQEMDQSGAVEVFMPVVQPAELWVESNRWDQYGPELMRMRDRHERDFCLGPTHEEVITDLARRELRSYKQLPINYYQIQTKFRDEIRPRFGVMRAREFIMKDAYSFHMDQASLQETYDLMYDTYSRIFTRCGLEFRAVEADTGAIGGSASHEFHVLASSGEDAIAFSDAGDYAANVELAVAATPPREQIDQVPPTETVDTPDQHSIDDVSKYLGVSPSRCVKTLIVKGVEVDAVALILRGDHELNAVKAQKLPQVANPLCFASEQEVLKATGCSPGSLGPMGLSLPALVDHSAAALAHFVCGANQDGKHLKNVVWGRDVEQPQGVDIRNVVDGDPSPDGKGTLSIKRGIEVGHIFKLGDKYSRAMNASVLDEQGKAVTLEMGCYGIGVTRIVAAAIEQNNDDKGIIWPLPIAPFHVSLIPVNMHQTTQLRESAEKLHQQLSDAGIEVLFDDREMRPGVMFADHELIGIPHRVVVSERGLSSGHVEYKGRQDPEPLNIPIQELMQLLVNKIQHV